jgi:putative FmdB family regulatory protein
MTPPLPTYVYKCDNGHTFEVIQSMSEDALDTCEVCGAPARRQLFAPAVHFKGSGFYTTDYARKGAPKPAANGSGGEGSGGDSKPEKKSDSSKSSDSGSSSKSEGKTASSKD